MRKDFDTALLIPIGSSQEKIYGISHLFEHILISEIKNTGGFTTEDYIFLYGNNINFEKFLDALMKIEMDKINLKRQKDIIKKEIERNKNARNEKFFKKTWEKTIYEKSPLGTVKSVEKINIKDLIYLKEEVLNLPLYFYNKRNKLNVINGKIINRKSNGKFCILFNKNFSYEDILYKVIYFKNEIEKMFVVEKILQLKNPERYIQISEKREMNAFIMEKNCLFPDLCEIISLREKVLKNLKKEIYQIRQNFLEIALNELESIYFYNIPWDERIDRLFHVSNNDILELINEIRRGVK